MGAVFTVLIILTVSLLVVRVATVGLTMTGLSKDLAHFQSLSAFTGSGFTTRESEEIVNHPVRRRIVMHLMLLGHGGIVLAIASVLLSFLQSADDSARVATEWWFKLLVLVAGVLVLWVVANSTYVERFLWRVNEWALSRWMHISVEDYTRLLRLSQEYVVCEMQVHPDNWLVGRTLAKSELSNEGILVLGIERNDGKYVGAPRGETQIRSLDRLILYGNQESLFDLEAREPGMIGNLHHVMAVTKQLDTIDSDEPQ